ncbi:hypothetical protein D3C85_1164540 [compost metagenome]
MEQCTQQRVLGHLVANGFTHDVLALLVKAVDDPRTALRTTEILRTTTFKAVDDLGDLLLVFGLVCLIVGFAMREQHHLLAQRRHERAWVERRQKGVFRNLGVKLYGCQSSAPLLECRDTEIRVEWSSGRAACR